ncbi:glycosyltransferase family 2 protein [Mycobacterium sherrisii]|uniref:Sugar transferase n=1 Tax=Mycobacterium sherrisii TaxID=243061 RepID=A0A1E3SCC9_9MYCO|nr:galactosyltransferase-related protein [Mycobacterium sherrisii]MCV7031968.1 glycosyltransferase family 2 protein [Mycobacterium sherrisii]ODQ99816.1 sugar transferase [Mycobacterium sherrisii]ORW76767.1 sugar transferase [Mycobacterium sherrisii]
MKTRKTAVITAVRGRGSHLRRQLRGLASSRPPPDLHVVVALGDPRVPDIVAAEHTRAMVVELDAGEPLPMAAARNQGAAAALRESAELLVFLDVDCIPSPRMIECYRRAAAQPEHADALLCGPVTYLAPPGPQGYAMSELETQRNPHPARPDPPDGQVVDTREYALFWSLSFALTATTWQRIGGFCERYRGYGGEDTDFGQCAAARQVPMRWVGGAHAFHQFHPTADPPTQHLDDILRNAAIFHQRWGWWPMEGWLAAFEADGLIVRGAEGRPQHADRRRA